MFNRPIDYLVSFSIKGFFLLTRNIGDISDASIRRKKRNSQPNSAWWNINYLQGVKNLWHTSSTKKKRPTASSLIFRLMCQLNWPVFYFYHAMATDRSVCWDSRAMDSCGEAVFVIHLTLFGSWLACIKYTQKRQVPIVYMEGLQIQQIWICCAQIRKN
jgi:hypothetical protein